MEEVFKEIENIDYDSIIDCDNGINVNGNIIYGYQVGLFSLLINTDKNISFLKKKCKIENNEINVDVRMSDLTIGFYSEVDVNFDVYVNDLYIGKQHLDAKIFSYPICNVYSPLFGYDSTCFLRNFSNNTDLYIVHSFVDTFIRKNLCVYNNKIITCPVINKRKIIYTEWSSDFFDEIVNIPPLINIIHFPDFYQMQENKKYQEGIKKDFDKEFGLKFEIMEKVWHPRNLSKFKYLDPDVFGDLDD
jgi:hypothetical protein